MAERQGIERLSALQRRWKAESIAYCLLLGLAVSVVLASALAFFWGWNWWVGVVFLALSFPVALWIFPYWRLTLMDTARYLDRQLPELEESCELLLRRVSELGPLERLQAMRTEARLRSVDVPMPFRRKLWIAGGVFLGAVIFGGVVLLKDGLGAGWSRPAASGRQGVVAAAPGMAAVAPGVKDLRIVITPPAYTGRRTREQAMFPLQVEEGSLISWEVETSGAVDTVLFLFNDTTRWLLRPVNTAKTAWRLSLPAVHPGFYQVRIGSQLSDLYKLEVIKDEPPKITIRTPKAYTVLDYGEPTRVSLLVKLQDDYGISGSAIMATVSSGKGEAVKFREQELSWGRGFAGEQSVYDLSKTLDLSALGLKPGDELYFYCRAKDNHGQEARTDTYIISLADTAQLMSLEGLAVPTDIKPEFFRSERQIIIEAEQLLKEKDTLDVTAFKNKSNDLGIDQKLLRLRYGKFLGEEAEEGGPGGDANGEVEKPGAFGDGAKILDAYTDKHDNAEDATYFTPAVKAQLKATLSEMWNAELRLRTYTPQEALPYAYKALRLLKDLQQQSRSYVAKTGVKTTPLNPAKRLTGELAAIQATVQQSMRGDGLTEEEILRIVLGLLEAGPGSLGEGSRVLMEQAERRLGKEAASRPGEFLAGYQAMHKLILGEGGDIEVAERAIQKLLPLAQAVPASRKAVSDAGLSQIYFSHLGKP
ncbi:MAG TPA: DUF4175 family protein [Puia sp.]|nr:DUF4175 family protein [Puia sp.]